MYSRKKLIIVICIEAIMIIVTNYMKPLFDNPIKEFIALFWMVIPVLWLLAIIALDNSISGRKRAISLGVFIFLLMILIVSTIIEFTMIKQV